MCVWGDGSSKANGVKFYDAISLFCHDNNKDERKFPGTTSFRVGGFIVRSTIKVFIIVPLIMSRCGLKIADNVRRGP